MKGKSALFIIAREMFRDEEYVEPVGVLKSTGVNIVVASSSLDKAIGKYGFNVKPQILVKDAKAVDYDAIVFVGGTGSREYFDNTSALKLAKDAYANSIIVAAICVAPHILANADILVGKNATTFPSEIEILKAKGANYTGKDVEIDGLIITANGPEAAEEFGQAIAGALSEEGDIRT